MIRRIPTAALVLTLAAVAGRADDRTPVPAPAVPAQGDARHVEPRWQTWLMEHIKRYRHYPSGALSRGEKGAVRLGFTVDRNGHVLNREIVRSSGYPELDNEVMSLIERAQPLPPFPDSMPEAELDLIVECFLLGDSPLICAAINEL